METLTRNKHLAYQGLGHKGNHLCENVSRCSNESIKEVNLVATRYYQA